MVEGNLIKCNLELSQCKKRKNPLLPQKIQTSDLVIDGINPQRPNPLLTKFTPLHRESPSKAAKKAAKKVLEGEKAPKEKQPIVSWV